MKKIALAIVIMALTVSTGSAFAANSLVPGAISLGVGVAERGSLATPINPLISGKYAVAKDMAILGGFGFLSGGPSGATTTTLAVEAGVRKYLKTDDYAPFVGGVFQYASTSGTPSSNSLGLAAEFGAEYFLARQFSIEGKAQFGYISQDTGGAKASYIGSTTAGLSVNFYF